MALGFFATQVLPRVLRGVQAALAPGNAGCLLNQAATIDIQMGWFGNVQTLETYPVAKGPFRGISLECDLRAEGAPEGREHWRTDERDFIVEPSGSCPTKAFWALHRMRADDRPRPIFDLTTMAELFFIESGQTPNNNIQADDIPALNTISDRIPIFADDLEVYFIRYKRFFGYQDSYDMTWGVECDSSRFGGISYDSNDLVALSGHSTNAVIDLHANTGQDPTIVWKPLEYAQMHTSLGPNVNIQGYFSWPDSALAEILVEKCQQGMAIEASKVVGEGGNGGM